MISRIRPWLLSVLVCWLSIAAAQEPTLPTQAPEHHGYVFTNATIIDPASRNCLKDAWVLVVGGKIAARGTGQPPTAATPYDLGGAYLLPGLIDAHLHLTAGPLEVTVEDGTPIVSMESREDITRFHARAALASGITAAFSPAGDPVANRNYARHQTGGDWLGPSLDYAGLVFDPQPIRGGSIQPEGEDGWREEIARQQALGVSHIKLYHGLSPKELARGIRLAREAGLKSIAHLDQVSWQFAVDAGIDALTHALPTSAALLPTDERTSFRASINPGSAKHLYQWFDRVDYDAEPMQHLIEDLAGKRVRVDLTLVVNELMYHFPEIDQRFPFQDWEMHPDTLRNWKRNLGASLHDWSEDDYQWAQQRAFPKVLEFLRRLEDAGVPLLIGSDSSSGGRAFWRELELHQQAGLSPWRILQMATSDAAELLELGHIGRIEPGYRADFVILAENPLDNISAVAGLTHVVQRGKIHAVEKLRAQLSCEAAQDCVEGSE